MITDCRAHSSRLIEKGAHSPVVNVSTWRFKSVPPRRSWNMAAIHSRDTTPERVVRSVIHRLGHRFRLYVKRLPGTPDIVIPRLRLAVFVHGCFWHAHRCSVGARCPKTNVAYWRAKRARNQARYRSTCSRLRAQGWSILTIWECQTKNKKRLNERLSKRLRLSTRSSGSSGGCRRV